MKLVGVAKYNGLLYEALSKTSGDGEAIIARFGVGHDGVDKSLAVQKNINAFFKKEYNQLDIVNP